jgi:hypothetical protein
MLAIIGSESFVFQFAIQQINIEILYRTILLRVVLYGRETWSLTLREERRPRVFENIWAQEVRGNRVVEKTS